MNDLSRIVREISETEAKLRGRLLNRTATFFLGSGKVRGKVIWVGNGFVEVLTERGVKSISYEEIKGVSVSHLL